MSRTARRACRIREEDCPVDAARRPAFSAGAIVARVTPVAAIDVGTNTAQMVVARPLPGRRFEVLAERAVITRLGAGVDAAGLLGEAGTARGLSALGSFAHQARALGATPIVACATSAVRDAANREAFVERVQAEIGVALEVITGEEEARLCFLAVQGDFGERAERLVAVDVGGGSTEVVVGASRGEPIFRHSAQVGSVRLTERFVRAHPILPGVLGALQGAAAAAFRALPPAPEGAAVIGVAATATSLLAVAEGLVSTSDPRVHGAVLHLATLEETVARLASLDLEARRQFPGLDPERAEVVCAGGVVLRGALRALGVDRCYISDRGLRWGLLRERFTRD
jgi:exopolyphosphatase/guanosine-5'-triphosphate,3'-diphosphate pyrophosphatase